MSATAPPLTASEADRLADRFEDRTAEHVLAWAAERFGERAVLTCSWQKQSSVLVHMVSQVAPGMRVVELDTGVLFPDPRGAGGQARRAAVGARSGRVLRHPQGRTASAGARRFGRVDNGNSA